MIRLSNILLSGAALAIPLAPSQAGPLLSIADASRVSYAVGDTRVFFRNLDSFDPEWLPCCYHY